MKAEKRQKVFVYKHALFEPRGSNLKEALDRALDKLKTVGARRESSAPQDESPTYHVIGKSKVETEMTFGVLMHYAPGTNPAFIVDDETATELSVEQLAAPHTETGKRRELVDAMLFFCVLDNHVVIMQSLGLRANHLERHLWQLLFKANEISGTTTLRLIDQPPRDVRQRLEKSAVKEVIFGGAVGAMTDVAQHATGEVVAGYGAAQNDSALMAALKRLLRPDQAARLNLDALGAEANIEYSLKIRYKRSTTQDGQRLMNTLGSVLRHTEDVETVVKLKDGEIKGEQLRLSGHVKIEMYNGIPSFSDVFEELRAWLMGKLQSGDIEASLIA